MSRLVQDVRYAARMLVKNPVFTAAAVVTLALGIGLNAAVFSAVHALLFRPLPGVMDEGRLVHLFRTYPGDFLYGSNSVPHYFDLRERGDVFDGVAGWNFVPLNLSTESGTERVVGAMVSANYFSVLGTEARLGRTFGPEEDVGAGAHPVAVISHGFWQQRFGGDPGVVGREIRVNGRPFTVVGVAPPEFRGTVSIIAPSLWVPLMMQNEVMPGPDRLQQRGMSFLSVFARLRAGVTVEHARQAMDALVAALAEEHPSQYEGSGILVVPHAEAGIHPQFRKTQVGMSAVIMTVVGLLLLIACVNVANLFLARASERRREMAIRLSIGAGRAQLVRQLLTESLVFSLLAGGLGLVLAYAAMGVANGVRPPIDIPVRFDFALDGPVLLFALGVSVLAGVVFGLAPALEASKPDLVTGLKGATSAARGSRSRLTQALVTLQMALSLLLLVSAGLFVRNLRDALAVDKGFRTENLLLASVDPGLQGYERPRTEAFYGELLERVRAVPGVRAAAIGEMVPLGAGSQQRGVEVPGYEPGPDERMSIDYNIVGPGYFGAMGTPLRGREFTEQDTGASPGVIIVNDRMAARFWPGENALGKRIRTAGGEREVVGVAAGGKYRTLGEEPLDYMYLPHAQVFESAMTLHVRTAGDPAAAIPAVRAAIRVLDPDLPIYDVRTMDDHLGFALLPARLAGTVLGLFGVLGLVLAAVGVYGVMAYAVARRTREIAIRLALGARRREVVAMVVKQGAILVAAGVAFGLAGAFAAGRLLTGMLYSGSAVDPVTYAGVPLVLAAVALLATWIPARRAAALDPMRVLRTE